MRWLALSAVGTVPGSLCATIPAVAGSLLLFVRAPLEERTLFAVLDGHKNYAVQARCRLLRASSESAHRASQPS